jgi:hypothetical protein
MSTCNGLAALDYANTKFSRGYSTTGVGMVVCARHEFIQPNGVGDLQKGEWCVTKHLMFFFLHRTDFVLDTLIWTTFSRPSFATMIHYFTK